MPQGTGAPGALPPAPWPAIGLTEASTASATEIGTPAGHGTARDPALQAAGGPRAGRGTFRGPLSKRPAEPDASGPMAELGVLLRRVGGVEAALLAAHDETREHLAGA